jgi:hypothetical protein
VLAEMSAVVYKVEPEVKVVAVLAEVLREGTGAALGQLALHLETVLKLLPLNLKLNLNHKGSSRVTVEDTEVQVPTKEPTTTRLAAAVLESNRQGILGSRLR